MLTKIWRLSRQLKTALYVKAIVAQLLNRNRRTKHVTFASYDALEEQDLKQLRAVLDELCAEKSISLQHEEAGRIAHNLVQWYLFGIRSSSELKAMLDDL